MGVGSDLRGGGYDRGGVNAGGIGGGLVEELDGAGEGEVGIVRRRVAAEIWGKSGSTRTAVAWVVRARAAYFGLATKVRCAGAGGFDAGDAGDSGVGIAVEGGAEMGGQCGELYRFRTGLHGGIVMERAGRALSCGRAPCAGGGHFVTCVPLWLALPLVAKEDDCD